MSTTDRDAAMISQQGTEPNSSPSITLRPSEPVAGCGRRSPSINRGNNFLASLASPLAIPGILALDNGGSAPVSRRMALKWPSQLRAISGQSGPFRTRGNLV